MIESRPISQLADGVSKQDLAIAGQSLVVTLQALAPYVQEGDFHIQDILATCG